MHGLFLRDIFIQKLSGYYVWLTVDLYVNILMSTGLIKKPVIAPFGHFRVVTSTEARQSLC